MRVMGYTSCQGLDQRLAEIGTLSYMYLWYIMKYVEVCMSLAIHMMSTKGLSSMNEVRCRKASILLMMTHI